MEPSQHKLKSLSGHHIKISDSRKQKGEEIARACVATAGDYCKFPLRGTVTGVRDESCVPCSCPEPGEGRQCAHTNIRAGPWLCFPAMTQPSHQTQGLCCHETQMTHPAPDPRKCSHQEVRKQQMWRWDMSGSSGEESTTPWGRKTQRVSLHHTASLAECDFILENPSSHLIHTDASLSDLQRVKPFIPAKISPAGRTPGV